MKVEVFTFNGSDIATNRQINEWLKERKPRIVKWMQRKGIAVVGSACPVDGYLVVED